jgi:uncharacterized protein (DUF2336 family)
MRLIDRILGRGPTAGDTKGQGKPPSYEAARAQAAHSDPAVRRGLATRTDLPPEILYYLAEDSDPEVRALIAANATAPRHADLLLARDAEPDVRAILAGKIARLAPALDAETQDKLHRMAYEALEILTRDQITRVRQIISEAIQHVAKAPPDMVRRLARDSEIVVAGPILQFSPVLTDADLLEIIGEGPIGGALAAIAKRRDLREDISDALAACDDVDAITALLSNASAQIREETLDRLVEGAANIENWHEPLVERRGLGAMSAIKLARIVAGSLLERLKTRTDFDESTMAAITEIVARRVEESAPKHKDDDDPLAAARAMHKAGTLTEETIAHAMRAGDRDFVIAALSVRSTLMPVTVKRILLNRSAKGSVALAWKAQLSSNFAQELQSRLALVPVSAILAPANGRFPLSEDEMAWQIELFAAMGTER